METKPHIREKMRAALERSGGDCFNISNDWETLLCLLRACYERFKEQPTEQNKEHYVNMCWVMEPFVGVVKDTEFLEFLEKHGPIIRELAPGSRADQALHRWE
jgi:hypothetical protein